jgi:hypothetical protein
MEKRWRPTIWSFDKQGIYTSGASFGSVITDDLHLLDPLTLDVHWKGSSQSFDSSQSFGSYLYCSISAAS